jgi:prolyl 4-hydroxylase
VSQLQAITPELRHWILDQVRAGHAAEGILQAMQDSGWAPDTALSAMEEACQAALGLPMPRGTITVTTTESAVPLVATSGHEVWAHDRAIHTVLSMDHPRVVVFGNVMSLGECADLRALASARLTRSETVVDATGGSEVNAARTSEGMFFSRGEHKLITRIEARLAALVNWPVDHGEGLQILRYAPGAQYLPHYDYFDPAQAGSAAVLRRGGQRVGTIVLYLNTPEEGGATVFPDVGLTVHPIAGQAVFFSYSRPDPDTRTLHGGAPVVRGEKWVATKWLRQGRFD